MPLYGVDPYAPGLGDGVPETTTLAGSGYAVPAGLEAVLEYNGLFLNVQKNTDRYKITNIDGLGDSDIRDTRDVNTDDDGETPFNAFLGGRTIVLTGTIETYSVAKLRDMQQALRAAFADVSQERPLHFRVGDFRKDHVIYCKKVASNGMSETQQNRRMSRDFQVTLRASNPRFLSWYQKFFYATPTPVTAPLLLGTLMNAGNYTAEPVYRIYGPSQSTTITNDTTGKSFTVSHIEFGNYFDFNIAKKSLVDSFGVNRWNNLSDDSDYVKMLGSTPGYPSGDNVFFFTGDSPRVEISWYDSWV
jgi:hypothetical protein